MASDFPGKILRPVVARGFHGAYRAKYFRRITFTAFGAKFSSESYVSHHHYNTGSGVFVATLASGMAHHSKCKQVTSK